MGGAIFSCRESASYQGRGGPCGKKREKEDEQRRERYILQMDSRKAIPTCYPAFVPALSGWKRKLADLLERRAETLFSHLGRRG